MRMSGESRISSPRYPIFIFCLGQRIVARLRERTYAATLRQEVEFVERGEGDALSRLSVDSSVVGERLTVLLCRPVVLESTDDLQSITQNLSDGLRAVVVSFAGREYLHLDCKCFV
jgi:ABC-type multidrug transport system fused ATPase/permease subunit